MTGHHTPPLASALAPDALTNGTAGPRGGLDHLELDELFAIALLADQREAAWTAVDASPIDDLEDLEGPQADVMHQLGGRLRDRILSLPGEASRELPALALLGNDDGGMANLARARETVDAKPSEHGVEALHRNLSLHRYLCHGLHRMGPSSWQVFARYPQMFSWLNLGSPGVVSGRRRVAPSLHDFVEVERQLKDAHEQAKLKFSFEAIEAAVTRRLTRSDFFDELGNDETFEFISGDHRKRHYGVAAAMFDIQIGKAYYFVDHDRIAGQRLDHARLMLSNLLEVSRQGDRITAQSQKGGKARAQKSDAVKQEFAKLLAAGKRGADWNSKDEAVEKLSARMRIFNDSLQTPPLRSDRMDGTLRRWLDTDAAVRAAYFGHEDGSLADPST